MRRTLLVIAILSTTAAHAKVPARPPDPRRGERLDGRAPPEARVRVARAVPRLVLAVPRVALRAIARPIVYATEQVEERDWLWRFRHSLSSEDGRIGLRPRIGLDTSFGFDLGLRFFDRRTMGPGSLIEARVDTLIGDAYSVEVAVRPEAQRYGVRSRLETHDSLRFYGTEGESRDELQDRGRDVAVYQQDRSLTMADVQIPIAHQANLELHAGADLRNFDDGTSSTYRPVSEVFCGDCAMPVVDETEVPGFREGTRRGIAGARLGYDQRDSRYATGVAFALQADWSRGFADDPSHDYTLLGDARAQVGIEDRALSVRGKAGMIEPIGDDPVPFSDLLHLGGSDGVRGLSSQGFQNHSILIGSLEYRFLLDPFFDVILFADYGGAFDRKFEEMDLDDFRSSFGVGLRRWRVLSSPWQGQVSAGLDVAWAPGEGFRLAFSGEL